jgi:hypothetical protein
MKQLRPQKVEGRGLDTGTSPRSFSPTNLDPRFTKAAAYISMIQLPFETTTTITPSPTRLSNLKRWV